MQLDLTGGLAQTPQVCSFIRACSGLRDLEVSSDQDADLDGAYMDVALAGNKTVTTYRCCNYLPATLPCSLQHIHLELGRDHASENGAAQLLIRLQQCPELQTIHFEAGISSQAPLKLSRQHLAGLSLPSLQSLHLFQDVQSWSFAELDWLSTPRSFQVYWEYFEGDWDGKDDLMCIEERRGHWLPEALRVLQPQDSYKANFSAVEALSLEEQEALHALQLASCVLTLAPQRLSFLPRCRSIQLCFGFCFSSKPPAKPKQAQLTWAALTACPARISIYFENWPRPKLRVIGWRPGMTAPAFAEPWLLCVDGAHWVKGLPPSARDDCYLLQNAAAVSAGW